MTPPDAAFEEADLHAFVDGCAPEDKAGIIRAAAAANPAVARDIENWRRQNAAIRRAFGAPAPAGPAPERKAEPPVPLRVPSRRRPLPGWALGFIVGALAASVGAFGLATITPKATAPAISHDALGEAFAAAFSAQRVYANDPTRPVEMDATDKAKLLRFLGERTGLAPRLPDLSALGFRPLGGRVVVADGEPAAFLVYEDSGKRRLGLLDLRLERHHETHVGLRATPGAVAWTRGAEIGVVTGQFDADRLAAIARAARREN